MSSSKHSANKLEIDSVTGDIDLDSNENGKKQNDKKYQGSSNETKDEINKSQRCQSNSSEHETKTSMTDQNVLIDIENTVCLKKRRKQG